MKKEMKILIPTVVVAVIIVAIISASCIGGKNKEKETTASEVSTSDSVTIETTISEVSTSASDNKENNEETNYWDTVEMYEDVPAKEGAKDDEGESVSEEYPGQNDGWSPIVSPEDLE